MDNKIIDTTAKERLNKYIHKTIKKPKVIVTRIKLNTISSAKQKFKQNI